MFSSQSSFPSSSNHFQRDFDRFSAETLVTRETKVSRESRETRHGYHGIDTCCRRNLQRVERLFDRAISTFSTIQSRCVYIYIYIRFTWIPVRPSRVESVRTGGVHDFRLQVCPISIQFPRVHRARIERASSSRIRI